MHHVMVEGFAFQEALLVEVVLAIAVLTMIYRGFRRWVQYKEKLGQLIADQTAERAAQYRGDVERVEARLKVIEQNLNGHEVQPVAQIDRLPADPLPRAIAKPDAA